MATKNENDRDLDFEAAFGDDSVPAAEQGDGFGLDMGGEASAPAAADAAETASAPEGEPAAVVIVAEAGEGAGGDASSEAAANDAAAAEARAVNDEANAAASTNKSEAATTGEQEAGSGDAAPTTVPDESVPGASGDGDVMAEAPHGDMPMADDEPTDPKDIQRKKSWEGRLRAEEKRLKELAAQLEAKGAGKGESGEQAAGDAIEQAAGQAQATGDSAAAAGLSEVASQVESGEISVEEALRTVSEDFGEQFTKMIQAIASKAAGDAVSKQFGERLGRLEGDTQSVIDHLTSSAEQAHYQQIYDVHPDFVEVSKEPGFNEFVAAHGKEDVVAKGSAKAINALLDEYKASKTEPAQADQAAATAPVADAATPAQDAVAAASQVDQGEVEAAEGVRSSGLRLPEPPQRADDDYAAAWEKF